MNDSRAKKKKLYFTGLIIFDETYLNSRKEDKTNGHV